MGLEYCVDNVIYNIFIFLNIHERYMLARTSNRYINYFLNFKHPGIIELHERDFKEINKWRNIKFKCFIKDTLIEIHDVYKYNNLNMV